MEEQAANRRLDAILYYARFLEALGLDLTDEHLRGTAVRVVDMYLGEVLYPTPFTLTTFAAESQELVVVRDIPFWSICAHHLLPFSGTCAVGYVPDQRMAGLSKLARVVDHAARRPQVQERLVAQVADTLMEGLAPHGVAVYMEAEHLCMVMRGVKKPGSITVTSALRGSFLADPALRQEFYALALRRP